MIIKGPPTSSEEYQIIFQWLEERFYYSIGAMAFLAQTQATNAEWQLLRLYDSRNAKQLLESRSFLLAAPVLGSIRGIIWIITLYIHFRA